MVNTPQEGAVESPSMIGLVTAAACAIMWIISSKLLPYLRGLQSKLGFPIPNEGQREWFAVRLWCLGNML